MTTTVRVVLPAHLKALAHLSGEVSVEVETEPSIASVLDALETAYPVLRGAIRQHGGERRRSLVRFFACQQDLSHDPIDARLPDAVVAGTEPLLVVGAMAGG